MKNLQLKSNLLLVLVGFIIICFIPNYRSSASIPMLEDSKMVPKSKSITISIKLKGNKETNTAELEAFISANRGDLTCKAKTNWKCPAELAGISEGIDFPEVE